MVVRVKPWGKDQGDFVEVDEDKVADWMELIDEPEPAKRGRPKKQADQSDE